MFDGKVSGQLQIMLFPYNELSGQSQRVSMSGTSPVSYKLHVRLLGKYFNIAQTFIIDLFNIFYIFVIRSFNFVTFSILNKFKNID